MSLPFKFEELFALLGCRHKGQSELGYRCPVSLPFKFEELFALQVVHIQVSVRAAVQVFQVVVQLHLLDPAASNIWQFIPVPHSQGTDSVHFPSPHLTTS